MTARRKHPTWGLLAAGFLASCATSSGSTWDDAASTGRAPTLGGPLPARPLDREAQGSEPAPLELAGEPIEVQLLRFSARRKVVVGAKAKAPGAWPDDVVALFQDLFDNLLISLDPQTPVRLSRRALIQARVIPEAELEMTTTRLGPPPPELSTTLTRVQIAVAWHMKNLALRDRGVESDSPLHGVTLVWPLQPVLLTSTFGYRRDPLVDEIRFHSGVDLGGQRGELVFAAGSGVVAEAGWMGAYGRRVVIQHDDGLATIYAHLDSLLVVEGVRVELGSPVGFLGASGRATGPHLHFEVRQFGDALDPLEVVGRTIARPRVAMAR